MSAEIQPRKGVGRREEYSNWQEAKNIFIKGIDKNKTIPDWAKQELKELVTEQFRAIGKTIGTYELLFLRTTQKAENHTS